MQDGVLLPEKDTRGVEVADTQRQTDIARVNRLAIAPLRHWLLLVNVLMGLFVGLPWLAPILMARGLETPARVVYFAYSLTCHQLPERSYFLFGPSAMYGLPEIQAVWPTADMLVRRQFIGTPDMGYKVAYSDRMVSMYTAIFIGGLLFALVRRRLRPLDWRLFLLLGVLPMFLDGFSHLVNDVTGWGFRDNNAWLATLTNHALPTTFYVGDALGSLNWWLRLITGLLFGLTLVWTIFPYLQREMERLTQ